jgi:hypothetical protein
MAKRPLKSSLRTPVFLAAPSLLKARDQGCKQLKVKTPTFGVDRAQFQLQHFLLFLVDGGEQLHTAAHILLMHKLW